MMYKFLPDQIENLKGQLETESLKFNEIREIRKANFLEKRLGSGNEISILFDNYLLENFVMNTSELNDIKKKLLNCVIIEPNNSDEIGIGSTFEISLFFDGEEEKSTFTLVETRLSKDPINYISISSPLGNAIIGKKQGDDFKYFVENSIISGRIDEVIKTNEKVKTK